MKRDHEWQTNNGLSGRSYDFCTRCPATAIRWLVGGSWLTRVRGPKECKEEST